MRITFLGAARSVTGSTILMESGGVKFLIDCGLPQGDDAKTLGLKLPFRGDENRLCIVDPCPYRPLGENPPLNQGGL